MKADETVSDRITVLIVGDHPVVRQSVRALFETPTVGPYAPWTKLGYERVTSLTLRNFVHAPA